MVRCALAFALPVLAGASTAALGQVAREPLVREIVLQGPTVVAFLPASRRRVDEAQTPTPAAYATAALGRVKWCLGARAASYHLFYADRIVVHLGERDETYEISDASPLPGALLLSPDENTRILFAGGGPRLVPMLRQAASEYFRTPCRG